MADILQVTDPGCCGMRLVDEDGCCVACGKDFCDPATGSEVGDGTRVPNARLRDASLEMLELLEWIVDGGWNDGPGSWVMLDRRVEEVIAKAKGE